MGRTITLRSNLNIMTPHNEQAKLRGVRDPGDAWVVADDGRRYWGKFGAAGLLAHDPERGILLQHRVEWSDHGGTWGIPGGAINQGEAAITGAIREAHEEAGVPFDSVQPIITHVINRGGWGYTTVIANVISSFEPQITDPESLDLRWVSLEEVENLMLHPGFKKAWPALKQLLEAGSDNEALINELNEAGQELTKIG